MNARISLQTRVDNYLAERRRLGFELHSHDTLLADFAQFIADRHHHGPLTVELMADWVRMGKGGLGTPETWYRRMEKLRRFIRYLQQFEPQTEMPDASILGPEPGRVAPHISTARRRSSSCWPPPAHSGHAAACVRQPSRPCLA